MQAGQEQDSRGGRTGLALSGGGFRATLFHIGALWRLNELGWLPRLDEVSSVSGGSITAAWLASRWPQLDFDAQGVARNFEREVAWPLEKFCARTIDVPAVLLGLLSPFHHPGQLVAAAYRRYLFGEATLQDLPQKGQGPRFTLYATSLQTGVSVRMRGDHIGDYRVGLLPRPKVSLAEAVAASSAFPPVFCPIRLDFDPGDWKQTEGADLYRFEDLRRHLFLADGGVYDNLGLETIARKCDTVLVSDAGAPLEVTHPRRIRWFGQLHYTLRVIDIISSQTRALRTRDLIGDFVAGRQNGTYWGIATRIADYGLAEAGKAPPLTDDNAVTQAQSEVRTRLNHFTVAEQGRLINWGYAVTDAAMRRHVLEDDPPAQWPRPAFLLQRADA